MLLLNLCLTLASTFLSAAQVTPSNVKATTSGAVPPGQQPTLSLPPSTPPTAMQLTIAAMISGQFANDRQYQDDLAKNVTGTNRHALIRATYVPALVPALGSAVVLYFEQRVNNVPQPVRQAIYAFNQESPCLVRMSTFDIANASRFSVTPEGLQALEKLQPRELTNRPECDAFWEEIGHEFFTSYLSTQQCIFSGPGGTTIRPDGSRNLTCSSMSFSEIWRRVPGGQVVRGAPSPYLLRRVGNLYPVPVNVFSSNKCFNYPCTNNSGSKNSGPPWSAIKEKTNYNKKSDSLGNGGI